MFWRKKTIPPDPFIKEHDLLDAVSHDVKNALSKIRSFDLPGSITFDALLNYKDIRNLNGLSVDVTHVSDSALTFAVDMPPDYHFTRHHHPDAIELVEVTEGGMWDACSKVYLTPHIPEGLSAVYNAKSRTYERDEVHCFLSGRNGCKFVSTFTKVK